MVSGVVLGMRHPTTTKRLWELFGRGLPGVFSPVQTTLAWGSKLAHVFPAVLYI